MIPFKTHFCQFITGLLLLASSTVLAKAVPERTDIDTRYKWDLSDMYTDATAWEADRSRFLDALPTLSAHRGKLDEMAHWMRRLKASNRGHHQSLCLRRSKNLRGHRISGTARFSKLKLYSSTPGAVLLHTGTTGHPRRDIDPVHRARDSKSMRTISINCRMRHTRSLNPRSVAGVASDHSINLTVSSPPLTA